MAKQIGTHLNRILIIIVQSKGKTKYQKCSFLSTPLQLQPRKISLIGSKLAALVVTAQRFGDFSSHNQVVMQHFLLSHSQSDHVPQTALCPL